MWNFIRRLSKKIDNNFLFFGVFVIIMEIVLNIAIIWKIQYTEIDWIAYMDEVKGFLDGNWNYLELRGPTGPIVYPAGFVYFFSILFYVTGEGKNVRLAQYIFLVLYILVLGVVLWVYSHVKQQEGRTKKKSLLQVPFYGVVLLCLSKRIHSIFVLRLFNDSLGMFFVYVSIILILNDYWNLAMLAFSTALSIKMNCVLFLPGLLVLLTKRFGLLGVIPKVLIIVALQLAVAVPFLTVNPGGYFQKSFELNRKFFHIWTVNLKFLPEHIFLSDTLDKLLLGLTVLSLVVFAWFKWTTHDSLFGLFRSGLPRGFKMRAQHIVTVLFTSNFIGIAFSRTLHFQFYVWYFHTIPLLLWATDYYTWIRFVLFCALEAVFNIYPSNTYSSLMLQVVHITLLFGLLVAKDRYPYDVVRRSDDKKKKKKKKGKKKAELL